MPYISFLGYEQETRKGIYPVLLYYRENNYLIVAYGVSATEGPGPQWVFDDMKLTIGDYSQENNNILGNTPTYGESYLHAAFQVDPNEDNFGLNETELMNALDTVIEKFHKQFSQLETENDTGDAGKKIVENFLKYAKSINFQIEEDLILRYVGSLLSKPFVILTGLSGSGKSKLAQIFVKWVCNSSDQYAIVPVGADWSNRDQLLGYPNALNKDEYVKPDNRVIDLLLAANERQNLPYFLILDEMNMSHVERYFADFLSAMESGEEIYLHPYQKEISSVPSSIKIPPNLFIVGTVNIDETTYMFSPKVLDRANVIEFRISQEEMDKFLDKEDKALRLAEKPITQNSETANLGEQFVCLKDKNGKSTLEMSSLNDVLKSFFAELSKIRAEFGYRTAYEINRFCAMVKMLNQDIEDDDLLDFAIIQKLLPKVHGSRRKLEPVLSRMIELCLEEEGADENKNKIMQNKFESIDKANMKYPLSLNKIMRMYHSLIDNGFTSFAES